MIKSVIFAASLSMGAMSSSAAGEQLDYCEVMAKAVVVVHELEKRGELHKAARLLSEPLMTFRERQRVISQASAYLRDSHEYTVHQGAFEVCRNERWELNLYR